MPRYKVMRSYEKMDNTLHERDEERVEYSITPLAFDTLLDARRHLELIATHEEMTILNRGLNAEKEVTTVDEETGIITTEKEKLSIVIVD